MQNTSTDILQRYWGYNQFRPLQEEIIRSALEGNDTLALLPTGGGKSICYQVPALCQEGICIVISPLIALMKDQVQNLRKRDIPAAAIYSGMSPREIDITLENACQGAYKLLYLSPERLKTDMAVERIKRMQVNLLAVDEAHCISQWGYDFRPSYLLIAEIRNWLPKVPVMALTATATPEVAKDIQEKLHFQQPNIFQQSFLRSNLSYAVLYEQRKKEKLVDILRKVPGSGIVYVRSRGETKILADLLAQKRISAGFYHAGLSGDERSKRQEDWISGKTRIIVCTNAFGMGIDKPDVRIVVHLSPPDSPEAYFQEAGRAGRDGQKAYAVLLYSPTDAEQLQRFFENAYPPFETVKRVYQAIGSYTQLAVGSGPGASFDFDLQHFCHTYKLEQATAFTSIRLLEQDGWLLLTDAHASPARIFLTAGREQLYDYQIRNKQADAILKILLRMYPGLQREYVDISESVIAGYARLDMAGVVKILQAAQKENILRYQPRNEKPQLVFLKERVDVTNLTIDQEKFNFRRKNALHRLEQILLYADKKQCRSQQLVAYFGEKNAAKCGICDICTGRNESDINEEVIERYEKKLREVLRLEPLSLEEVLKAFTMKRHALVVEVLQFLTNEGKIEEDESGRIMFL